MYKKETIDHKVGYKELWNISRSFRNYIQQT